MPLIKLRPRLGGASKPATTQRPLARHLAGGGLFGAIGDAFAKYVPPVHVPIPNIQQAAPVDVAAAWDAADKTGAEAGAKSLDGYQTQMKEVLDKQKLSAFDRTELEDRHMEFLKKQQARLSADPAFFNSRANQLLVQEEAKKLIDPAAINAAANRYDQVEKYEAQLNSSKQLGDVAFDDKGMPMDETYGDFFTRMRQEQSPYVMSTYFPYKRDAQGKVSISPFMPTMPSGTAEDAKKELLSLEEKIKPWATESGSTTFAEQVPAQLQALWQQAGGGAYGVRTSNTRTKQEQNLDQIKALTSQLAQGDAWRTLVSPNAAQSLLAEQYREVSKAFSNFKQTLGVNSSKLRLSVGDLPLGSSHLEARQKIQTTLRLPQLPDDDRNKLLEAYSKLRAYDLTQAENQVRQNLIARLNLQKYNSISKVVDDSLQTGGVKPEKGEVGAGTDIYAGIAYGTGLNLDAPGTVYEAGKDASGKEIKMKGLPYWSGSVAGSDELSKYMHTLTTNVDSKGEETPKTAAELAANGLGIYNAFTLNGIARPGSQDPSLKNIRVLPGGGMFTYLPHDPRTLGLQETRDKIARLEKGATAISKELKAAQQAGNKVLVQQLEARKAANLAEATAAGLVPAFRVKMVAQQEKLPRTTAYTNSVAGSFDTSREITSFGFALGPISSDVTQKTGVQSITNAQAEKAGFSPSWYVPGENYVQFDGYVTDPNFHVNGSEKSQLRNTGINNTLQQREVGQAMMGVVGAANAWNTK